VTSYIWLEPFGRESFDPELTTQGLRAERLRPDKLLVAIKNLFGSLVLGIWILFAICYLVLEIKIFKGAIFRYPVRLF
jgi:hypothetical protein